MRVELRTLRRRTERLVFLVLSCGMLGSAHAGAWIPLEKSGSVDIALRQYEATKIFLPGQYGTATLPGSERRYTMLRITGVQGLDRRLSIEYDLRAARVEKSHLRNGRHVVSIATGVQDQEIGLNVGLTQRAHFADSIALNVVVATGSVDSVPALGGGHTALEPDLQIGVTGARWHVLLKTGSRVFVDSGVTQMRAELDTTVRLTRRLELGAIIFYVRTVDLPSPLPSTDRAERYDLLRPGLRVKYRMTHRLKPFIEYEQDVAGEAIHTGRRITAGLTYSY